MCRHLVPKGKIAIDANHAQRQRVLRQEGFERGVHAAEELAVTFIAMR